MDLAATRATTGRTSRSSTSTSTRRQRILIYACCTNIRRRNNPEFELLDTGVFAENRYFDVFVEYAKCGIEDILIRITAINRGPESATLHLLPTLWFRNTWSWGKDLRRPTLQRAPAPPGALCAELEHWQYGKRWFLST